MGDGAAGLTQHIAMRWQDELDRMLRTRCTEQVQRIQVVGHVAIGRVNDGGAAVQNMVAAQQQTVFDQHQAQVVSGVARRVQHHEGMADIAVCYRSFFRYFLTRYRNPQKDQSLIIL